MWHSYKSRSHIKLQMSQTCNMDGEYQPCEQNFWVIQERQTTRMKTGCNQLRMIVPEGGFLALAEPNLRVLLPELVGLLPVNICRKWRHSPRYRHHLQGKRPTETESSTSSREPKWYFLLKVTQKQAIISVPRRRFFVLFLLRSYK